MALGKVCVGSDVGGLTERIRHGETGVIFRSGDASELADVVVALMDDPDRMRQLGAAARGFVQREREWSAIVEHYREVYDRAVHQNRTGITYTPNMSGPRGRQES